MSRATVSAQVLWAAGRYKARRALGWAPRTIQAVADREWIIAPGLDEPAVPPFIPDTHVRRIQGGMPGETVSDVCSRLSAPRHVAEPTRGYLLRNVALINSALYCGMHKEDLFRGMGLWPSLFREPAGELKSGVWSTTHSATRWYGHFLHDELPLQQLAHELGIAVGHSRPVYAHEPDWRKALGVPAPAVFGLLRVRELTYIDDIGQNPQKRKRYASLRERLASLPRGHDRVLILRPESGGEPRGLVNQAEITEVLVREGFHVIDPSTGTVDDLVRHCAGASTVVSVDGSHAAPALYLAREGATFLTLLPPARVTLLLPQLAGFFGLRGAMFVGEPTPDSTALFRVDPGELLHVFDQAGKR